MNNYTIINVTSFKFHVSGYTKSPARLGRGTGVIQNCKVHFAKCRYITKNGYIILYISRKSSIFAVSFKNTY